MNWKRLTDSLLRRAALALLLALPFGAGHAVSESDLLPVDEAFVIESRVVDRNTVTFRFRIAEGYYLYRERMNATVVDPTQFTAEPLQTPPGEPKDDEFFGRVETYRGDVTATLVGQAADGATAIEVKLGYQGCADIGICYPPQRKVLRLDLPQPAGGTGLTLPNAGSNAGLLVDAAPPKTNDPLAALSGNTSGMALGGTDLLPLPEDEAFRFEVIAGGNNEFLARFTMPPDYYLYRDRSGFELADVSQGELGTPRWPASQTLLDPEFGNVEVFFDLVEVPIRVARRNGDAGTIALTAHFQGCIKDGVCYPPMSRTIPVAFGPASTEERAATAQAIADEVPVAATPIAAPAITTPLPEFSFWQALLAALLGGLILNLMPCVLPVLSLKALSLTSSGETPSKARAHALWYTAGVLVSFAAVGLLVIALRSGGAALGWGFQLQQPIFVGLMAYVMLAFGLSLSGVILFGGGLANIGQGLVDKGGAKGDFFTGVLAVVVASPCTAPFMGGALSFAFNQSSLVALVIFLALGLGLALPFLLVGFVPALAQRLPKPGAWMETLKQWLAYPLYITAIWLAWVLGHQRGADAMAVWLLGALALTAALWWWEKTRYADAPLKRTVLAGLLMLASGLALWTIHTLPTNRGKVGDSVGTTQPYAASTLADLRAANTPVFVNMTADWCVSCKVNERSTLSGDRFRKVLADTGTVYLKGDWTNEDPAITEFLKQHGAVGVPLYVYFGAGAAEGKILPTILTPDMVERTIRGTD
ncbi:MAG: protein-disulfide reductase DsbD [Ahniella sp.]|nr:protein-disulfide reductase DsbD [Ahniella sp.]